MSEGAAKPEHAPAADAGPTAAELIKLHGAVVVPLADVCEKYAGVQLYQARIRANRNALPFPAFKLEPGRRRSPWMVNLYQLAESVDRAASAAQASWRKSQL